MTNAEYERIPHFTMGDRLRKARSLTGLNTRDFATRIGVSHGTVTNSEGDKVEVRRITLNAWALATGVPVEWLEHGTEASRPPHPEGEPETFGGLPEAESDKSRYPTLLLALTA